MICVRSIYRIAYFSFGLVHSAFDYCASTWCRSKLLSTHTCLIDKPINETLLLLTNTDVNVPPQPTISYRPSKHFNFDVSSCLREQKSVVAL